MNSSTSSFRYEAFAIMSVLATVLLAEGGLRQVETSLSKDVANIAAIPKQCQSLANSHQPSILVLGNSMVRKGFDQSIIRQGITHQAPESTPPSHMSPAMEFICLDGSDALEWEYALQTHTARKGFFPDFLVLGITQELLSDKRTVRPQRLALNLGVRDIPQLAQDEHLTFEQQCQLHVCNLSALVRNNDRIRSRLFDTMIPGYRHFTSQFVVGTRSAMGIGSNVSHRTETVENRRLQRLLSLFENHPTEVVAVALPLQTPYELKAETRSILSESGVTLLDARHLAGLSSDGHFEDAFHLNAEGAELLSRWLVSELRNVIGSSKIDSAITPAGTSDTSR